MFEVWQWDVSYYLNDSLWAACIATVTVHCVLPCTLGNTIAHFASDSTSIILAS